MLSYPVFLNIFLGLAIILLFIFYQRKVDDFKKAREEIEAVLEIRTKAKTRELEELAESLEEKVKERTRELQERVRELERFHQITVGRELKLIKFKEEIKRLEGGLKKLHRKGRN